jgi:hypothetical protein
MFQNNGINRAFIVLIAANGGVAVLFLGTSLVVNSPMMRIMGFIFLAATALMVGFMMFLRSRFKDL